MKPRILVIDDEAAIRDSLRMILEYEHYEFLGASNGPEGLAQVQRERPDLVLLDIKMPGMDGMEVLRKLRELDDTLPVVIISGFGFEWEAELMGAQGYIGKPFESQELEATIANLLRPRLVTSRIAPEKPAEKLRS